MDGPPVYPPDINGPLPYNTYVTPNGLTPPYDFSTAPPAWIWSSVDYYRYWGVFLTDWTITAQPQYEAVYNYSGNPSEPDDETILELAKRDSYCDRTWADAAAVLNTTTNTLTKSGEVQNTSATPPPPPKIYTEYILAGNDQPLAIALAYFTASIADDCIAILWETAAEIDTMGFQLWRSEAKNGPYTLVPNSFTASKSVTESQGATYAFTDCGVMLNNNTEYYYKLEEIDLDSEKNNPLYGPIGPVTETISASQSSMGKASSDSDGCFIDALR